MFMVCHEPALEGQ